MSSTNHTQTVPIKRAAKLLGISVDALMKKIQRGGPDIQHTVDDMEYILQARQLPNKRWVLQMPTALVTTPATADEEIPSTPPPEEAAGATPAAEEAELLQFLQSENQKLRQDLERVSLQVEFYQTRQQDMETLIMRLHQQALEYRPEVELRKLPPPEPPRLPWYKRVFGRKS